MGKFHRIGGNGQPAVPIIGADRSWKFVSIVPWQQWQPMPSRSPLPEIGSVKAPPMWVMGMQGVRSDGFPVRAFIGTPETTFGNVAALFVTTENLFRLFESFRNCACQKQQPCDRHRQQGQGITPALPPLPSIPDEPL